MPGQDAKLAFYKGLGALDGSKERSSKESKDFSDNSRTDRVKYLN